MMGEFTHFDEKGHALMVDVSEKENSVRVAVAKASISMNLDAYEGIQNKNNKKGDVLGVARVAAIMAAKKTSDLIPMCHPLMITKVKIDFELKDQCVLIEAVVKSFGQTGVEMEALTAASTAALTIYDMCKALDKKMIIGDIYLLKKTGGKSGDVVNEF
jgi:cyclic pyranopterin phosphate synthase